MQDNYMMNQPPTEPQQLPSQVSYYKQRVDPTWLMFEHDFSELLDDFENKLRGKIWDSKRDCYVQKYKPYLNEEGINSVMMELQARVSKLLVLSNYSEEEITAMLITLTQNFILEMFMKADEWEIDYAYMSKLVALVQDIVRASFNRGLNAGERGLMKETTELREIRGQEQKKSGIFKFIPGM